MVPAFAILGLCVLDAALTVMLMKHGAVELNPVMASTIYITLREARLGRPQPVVERVD